MHYIKQLDSLRAIAVILVIIHHWFPEDHPLSIYTSFFNGVDIFFALSGFLITRILLANKVEAERTGGSKAAVIKGFYIRRTLRIFPIYYLLIGFMFFLGPKTSTDIRENIVYFLTYTSNFYFYKLQDWDGMLSHLWSLSVEEQFYLLWPWLMLYTHKRFLLPVIITSVLVGVFGQLILFDENFSDILTFACFDGFGLGGLLAWIHVYRPDYLKSVYTPFKLVAIVCCILQAVRVFSENSFMILPSRTLTSFCTLAVIMGVLLRKEERPGLSGFILNNRGVLLIGKISYGIYLYHFIVPQFTGRILSKLTTIHIPNAYHPGFYLLQIGYFGILLLVAYTSWRLIEQPILRYKKHFAYQKAAEASTVKLQKTKDARALTGDMRT